MRLIDADEIRIKPEYMHDICGSVMIRVEDVARIINEMPTINLQSQWTPCSERLPEENVNVLVWCGEVKIARIIRGISKEQRAKMQEGAINNPVSYGWNLSNGYFEVKRSESYRACDENGNNKVPYCWNCIYGEMFGQDVKAWMPLPSPYREEADEVEPEIIRCKDCVHYSSHKDDYMCGINVLAYIHENDFCSRAERRTQ